MPWVRSNASTAAIVSRGPCSPFVLLQFLVTMGFIVVTIIIYFIVFYSKGFPVDSTGCTNLMFLTTPS